MKNRRKEKNEIQEKRKEKDTQHHEKKNAL